MRIGVVGAGAVGGTLAALLERDGHEPTVTARGENLAALRERGLLLTGAWGEHRARLTAAESLPEAPELAIVAVKADQAAEAIRANRERLQGIPVLVVQNGLGSVETAARLLPDSECLGGLALFAASLTGPGEVEVTAAGTLAIGRGAGAPPAAARVADLLARVLPTSAVSNFAGCRWTKLIVNQVNALPAITGLSVQEVVADQTLRRLLTASMREAVRVGLASGVRFGALQGLDDRRLRLFARAPLALGQALPRAMARRMGARPNPGSTLQSIRRGRPTEVDDLNGAVVAAARAAGRHAPLNAALTALVHEVETRGRFLTLDEAIARVPAAA